ncbi:late sexual development protein [Curvularia clavata]|uniref:Late sexual development protein n=1 Tax=Curvularia clavata TaxID=95742 RepID=A0A9Q8ZDX4_CURCL|nr:late sexual development protein [Curvularia clavata]
MRYQISYLAFIATNLAYAAPTGKRDSSSDQALLNLEREGQGILPNGPPPPTISPDGATNLKLIAFNELFEVAFFTELVANLTAKIPGYDLADEHDYVLDAVKVIAAQEEMHAVNANGALTHFNQGAIQPCKYSFPVSNFTDAIRLAATFTDMVLGTLQDVSEIFARSGDFDLVHAVASVIGNEGEQEGFFRVEQGKRPSAQPFLTGAARDFAFTAIQSFVIEGSCPSIGSIPLKTFKPLTVETKDIHPKTQNLTFSFSMKDAGMFELDQLRLVFLNGQNVPLVKKPQNVEMLNERVAFQAEFPFEEFVMQGLTIAAVTMGADHFAGADDVAKQTIFGPGIIEMY